MFEMGIFLVNGCLFPTGSYHGLELTELNKKIQDEYGNIAKMPGLFGKPDVVFVYDPNDFEMVFRNEGPWPYRRGFTTLTHYRKDVRTDIFKNVGGLACDQGEAWGKIRSAVNPILMKPATVNAYIPVIDDITTEFCAQMRASRDQNQELPANFLNDLNSFTLETISFVALDHRLGIVGLNKKKDIRALNLLKAMQDFFSYIFPLETKLSLWRYIRTPTYTKLMNAYDRITE